MTTSEDFEREFARSRPPGGGPGRRSRVLMGCAVVVLLAGFVIVMVTGQGGFVEVKDTQVAVVVNYLSGHAEIVRDPGYRFFAPFVEQAFLFDKSIQEFVMSGDRDIDSNHVSKLTVRANDGSNFWFDEVRIQYEIQPGESDLVLSDSGSSESFKQDWVRAFARSILRDEFGRFSASEVADPTNYNEATLAARQRLNDALLPHGIDVVQIITPKPKFDPEYEQAIEDRKVANQEVERIKARAEQLVQERERRLAEIESEKAVAYETLKGTLEAERIAAEQDQVRVQRSADAYKTRLVGEGQASLAAMTEQARAAREKALKESEGLKAITEALEAQGEVLVRERLAERLGDVEFTLVPYTRDATPARLEVETAAAAAAGSGGN
ncbi:MAG: hypothetical protein H6825_02535 [Planctomycetes bacterium]|nr:hypothetical protein [Planctomycetota bacterium]